MLTPDRVFAGFVDCSVHITGGGGELGPASRTPEATVGALIEGGLTTVVGVLGTDCISRSLENLVVKCRALNDEGITAFMWTGASLIYIAFAPEAPTFGARVGARDLRNCIDV
jgi:isoaspartyl dipeptidase IadA